MPRFVVLEHDHPLLHWDFMLECGAALRTWRLLAVPAPHRSIRAEALGDHRLAYLDYEGPVSGNRGQVRRWDAGTFRWAAEEPGPDAAEVRVVLDGRRLKGTAVMQLAATGEWTFTLTDEPRGLSPQE